MNIYTVEELSLVGVFDPGVPNMERIVLRAEQPIDLANYGLMLGVRGPEGGAFPLRDNLLWFGNGWIGVDDWLFVYTAPGVGRVSEVPNSESKLVSIHWGKKQTVFQNRELVPILFRMDAVHVYAGLPALEHGQQAGL
jgi:hypothetical protein